MLAIQRYSAASHNSNRLNSKASESPTRPPRGTRKSIAAAALVHGKGGGTVAGLRGSYVCAADLPTEEKKPPLYLLVMLAALTSLEGCDMSLMPAISLALQLEIGISFSEYVMTGLLQGILFNLFSVIWVSVVSHGLVSRRVLLGVACVMQGISCMTIASIQGVAPLFLLRALNGVILSSLRPVANGIIADSTSEEHLGTAFAWVSMGLNFGLMIGSLVGTPLSRRSFNSVSGWRVAPLCIGPFYILVGLVTFFFLPRPSSKGRRRSSVQETAKSLRGEVRTLLGYFKLPTFMVLLAQDFLGNIPWYAVDCSTIFFQIAGLSDTQAGVVQAALQLSAASGAMIGGLVADRLSNWSPMHGRPHAAIFSVLAGIPLIGLIYRVVPALQTAFWYYIGLMIALGLLASWRTTAVALPLLSQIVEVEERGGIMVLECCIQGIMSSLVGNLALAVLAKAVFNFDIASVKPDGRQDLTSMLALGNTLACVACVPLGMCAVILALLHVTYPKDLAKVHPTSYPTDLPRLKVRADEKEKTWGTPRCSQIDEAPSASVEPSPDGVDNAPSLCVQDVENSIKG